MARALDVAHYLMHLAAAEVEPDYLTHLRLQKLLYYVQGWSLAMRGRPLFPERIEAWAHGPVVRDLYPHFAAHGPYPIIADSISTAFRPEDDPQELDEEEKALIRDVWEVYKSYSATHLRKMTHAETPWREARGDLGPADRCHNAITLDAMRRYFDRLAESD